MPTMTLIRQDATIVVEQTTNLGGLADWESPGGRDEACFPRLQRPAYVFVGPGDDQHWIGQSCHAVDAGDTDGETPTIMLACGCRARVPRSTLRPIRS